MVDISTLDGITLHLEDDGIIMVTGPRPDDPPDRCYITGPSPAALVTGESADAVLARLDPKAPLAQLTRPDGSPVWIAGCAVSLVRAPLADEIPSGGSVGAVVTVGGHHQAVQESVATVRDLVNQHGGKI